MKITKKQFRRLIQEAHSLNISPDRAEDIFAMISEMGFRLYDAANNTLPTWMDSNSLAVDDAMAAYPGEFTYDDVEAAVKFIKDAGWMAPPPIREGYEAVPKISFIQVSGGDLGKVNTISPEIAGKLENLNAECFDIIDEIALGLEMARSTPGPKIFTDPRLREFIKKIDESEQALHDAQMLASHLRDNTGG